ncbi:MAG: hypothetical protein J7J52_04765 [Deltaproteobacteria bacterium]|nr:hypothetical protein [Deltaproteobacteria bacterium]
MKTYTLRDIPSYVHAGWKAAAAVKGLSMKQFCYMALLSEIQKTLGRSDKDKEKQDEE